MTCKTQWSLCVPHYWCECFFCFFLFFFFCFFYLSDAFLLLPLLLYFIFINYEYCFNCRQVVLLVLNIYNVILKCFQRFSRMIYMSHLKPDCMWLLFRLHLMYPSILTMRIMYILCPIYEPGHSKTYAITFASIEDLDQPEHPAVWTRSSQYALLNFIFHTLYLSHACKEFARISYTFASVIYMYGKFWDFEVRFFWSLCLILGVFQAKWKIRIHATYKIDRKLKCHTCVTNAFEICDVFVRNFHTLWKVCANSSHMWQIWNGKNTIQQLSRADSEDWCTCWSE